MCSGETRWFDSVIQDRSPTLMRHPSNPVPVRSRSRGRYDVPDGGMKRLYFE